MGAPRLRLACLGADAGGAAPSDDREALERATVPELARLLTVVIRSEKFGEGAVADAIESGLVTAVLRRIEQLRREA